MVCFNSQKNVFELLLCFFFFVRSRSYNVCVQWNPEVCLL